MMSHIILFSNGILCPLKFAMAKCFRAIMLLEWHELLQPLP